MYVSPYSDLWTTYDVRNSHESAARALKVDGRSHGLAKEDLVIAETTFLAWDQMYALCAKR